MERKRGFTLIELLVVMAIIALLISLLLPALAKARAQAKLLKDGTQIKEVHKAWTIFANENNSKFPTPGLIDRLPDPDIGRDVPGRGPEDQNQNTTANMYSACIAQNYFTPELCVGPTEPSGNVLVMDNYNYNQYQPVADTYWDPNFRAELDFLCHTSYAHMPIVGERKTRHWNNSMDSDFAIVGNRGVKNGRDDNQDWYDNSVTLEIHGGSKEWVGNVCFNDNHIEVLRTFYPEGVQYRDPDTGDSLPDNIFRNDSGSGVESADGTDSWLTIISSMFVFGDSVTWKIEWDYPYTQ